MAGEARSNDDIPPCLAVVMAVYNEEGTVSTIVESVLQQRPVKELIIVDDCSRDKTWEQLQKYASDSRVKLIRQTVNQGKGAALRTGFKAATSPILIIQDADTEYDPREYYVILNPIVTGKADVVFGSRF